MSPQSPPFLAEMERLATIAQNDELTFRQGIATEIARRERARQFAFRRVELVRLMAGAASSAETEDDAIVRQNAALCREFGWYGGSDRQARCLDAWRTVATAVWHHAAAARTEPRTPRPAPAEAGEAPSVHDALLAFEAWYETETGAPFLAALDHEMPEIPVVEF